jgi:hypothetical protein
MERRWRPWATRKELLELAGIVEELKAAFKALEEAFAAKEAAVKAEFEKLEKELTEKGVTAEELAPLKAAIEAQTSAIAGEEVPTA